ncbi:MAG: S8 family peptidase [Solirubrobacterales bacterium]
MTTLYSSYGIKMLNSAYLWNQGYEGRGVTIAILDTGCDIDHPDLKENIIGGYNFTSDYANNPNEYSDNNGHGTHVAGIIAATGKEQGVVGVAPKSNILILKTLTNYAHGAYESIINAIKYCINWTGPCGEKVRIISMSLGIKDDVVELHSIIKEAIKNNIIIVCSAGNMGDGDLKTIEQQYPAIYPEVISVGAIDSDYKMANFSSTNTEVDILAPGVGIYSTFIQSSYATFSGTSMAAPYVTGAIALIINKYEIIYKKSLDYSLILQLIYKHTKLLNYPDSNWPYRLIDLSI